MRPLVWFALVLMLAGGLLTFPAEPAHAQESLPEVTLSTEAEVAVEGEPVEFTVTRTGSTEDYLSVYYVVDDPGDSQETPSGRVLSEGSATP